VPLHPTLLLINGHIHTMERHQPEAPAVAVLGDTILAVGEDEDVLDLAGPRTEVIDLAGRAVYPGFIDSHIHLASYAQGLSQVRLQGARSLEEALHLVETKIEGLGPGQWVLGHGWDHNEWLVPAFPTKEPLDRIAPNNPVALRRKDGHSLWVNSEALRLAGIHRDTPDPPGGCIDRDPETQEPTGLVRENAIELVAQKIPAPAAELEAAALEEAIAHAQQYGLTGIHDCEGSRAVRAFGELESSGRLGLRVYMLIPVEELGDAIRLGLATGFGNTNLRLGPVKIFADGSLGSQTALMLEPFQGQATNFGVAATSRGEICDLVRQAGEAGIAAAVHAIGDRAVRQVLDVYEATQDIWRPRRLRQRIEHVQLLHPADVPRLARLGVIASMQPLHATSDRDVADRLWGERCCYAYAWRSLLDAGTALAFGSDCPVETLDPLRGIHAAVTRKRVEEPDVGSWYPQERISVPQAVHAYTLGAAYASGEDSVKGSLASGKLADMVVLDRDIFQIPPDEIPQAKVEMTVLGGQVVFQR